MAAGTVGRSDTDQGLENPFGVNLDQDWKIRVALTNLVVPTTSAEPGARPSNSGGSSLGLGGDLDGSGVTDEDEVDQALITALVNAITQKVLIVRDVLTTAFLVMHVDVASQVVESVLDKDNHQYNMIT